MIEIEGNIWDVECDWICIPTNGCIKRSGKAVMGKGFALEAKRKYKDIDIEKALAKHIQQNGHVFGKLLQDSRSGKWICSFPTKNNWRYPASLRLIEHAAVQLKTAAAAEDEKPVVAMPRPGCGMGKLLWPNVKKVIGPILSDDNFVIVNLPRTV